MFFMKGFTRGEHTWRDFSHEIPKKISRMKFMNVGKQGRIQDFKLGGAHLKKIVLSGGRRVFSAKHVVLMSKSRLIGSESR
jgi:hypothetical protein